MLAAILILFVIPFLQNSSQWYCPTFIRLT